MCECVVSSAVGVCVRGGGGRGDSDHRQCWCSQTLSTPSGTANSCFYLTRSSSSIRRKTERWIHLQAVTALLLCVHMAASRNLPLLTNAYFLTRPFDWVVGTVPSSQGRGRCHIFTCVDYYCSKLVTHALGNDFMSSLDFVCRRTRCCFDKWNAEAGCDLGATVGLSEDHLMMTELHSGWWPPHSCPASGEAAEPGGAPALRLRMLTSVGTGPPPKSTQTMLTHRRDWFPVTTGPGLIGKPPLFFFTF